MKVCAISFTPLILFGLLSLNALAQDANPSQDQKQSVPQHGQRGERGAWGGGVMGRGVMGTVTEVTADHFTIKTDAGETYTIHYSVNTRIMKGGGRQRRDD